MSETDIRVKTGAVVILDTLGARTLTAEWSLNFIKRRDALIEAIGPEMETWYQKMTTSAKQSPLFQYRQEDNLSIGKPEVVSFGDTILLTWEIGPIHRWHISGVGLFLSSLFVRALDMNLFFRGAISYGEYVQSKNTVLGPAVADAASWYEKADWIGIVAAPMSGMVLSRISSDREPGTKLIESAFVHYPVPINRLGNKWMWAINWPGMVRGLAQRKLGFKDKTGAPVSTGRSYLFSRFEGLAIPPEVESKYHNTIEFYDWCVERTPLPDWATQHKELPAVSGTPAD